MNAQRLAFCAFIVVFGFCTKVSSQTLGTLYSLEGRAEVQRRGDNSWQMVQAGNAFSAGDVLRTTSDSRAAISMVDGVLIRLNEETVFRFEPRNAGQQPVRVEQGDIHLFSRKPKVLPTLNTNSVSAAIRGTELTLSVHHGKTVIALIEGSLIATNKFGAINAQGGEQVITTVGVAPTKGILLNPADAVQWALYYPPVLAEEAPPELRRAELLISRGDIAAAEQLLVSSPRSGREALQAIIALVRNERVAARELADRAIAQSPQSASGYLASSYVAQADFNLESALVMATAAVERAPSNALVFARLAEVQLALGYSKEALETAERAAALPGDSARVDVILGFTRLLRNESDSALRSFDRAISREPGLGLAYLGRGLTLIKGGALEAGRKELEKSAALEPTVSIYRSYLGKAYFEEENEEMAGHEFERAIALDPQDPTAYLYRAYNNLSQNKLVDALNDFEDSIARNKNRAVYRSSLLLDQDSAVRSAGLAQIFSSLGFNRVATVEAAKAITKDYGNYAAHRFLADSAATISQADQIVSERTIANLLAPLSFNLFNSSSSASSLNEYNSLFERPEHRTNVRFEGNTYHQLYLPEVFQSGRGEEYGYLVGAQGAFSDGSHDGDVGRDYLGRAAVQYQPSPENKLLMSGQYQDRSVSQADAVYYDTKFEVYDVRLGYQHRFDPSSQFLFELSHRHSRDRLEGLEERNSLIAAQSQGETFEFEDMLTLQQLANERVDDIRVSPQFYRNDDLLSTVLGGEYYHARPDRDETSVIVADEQGVFDGADAVVVSASNPDIDSARVYAYPTWHLTEWFDITTGLSYNYLELERREVAPFTEDTRTVTEWTPKLGAVVELLPELTLRSSYFKSVRKSALEDVGSIEPTLVGGLSQTFTDFSGTMSENWAVALDYKWAKSTYVGATYLRRNRTEGDLEYYHGFEFDLDSGNQNDGPIFGPDQEYHVDEDVVTAYVNQVITERLVAGIEYSFDNVVNNDPELYERMELNKVAGSLRYFDPTGWFLFTQSTWREQDRTNSLFAADGVSSFWVVDAGVGYRLPRRHGSIVVSVNNILDKDFTYDQSQGLEPFVVPETSASLVLNVNF